MKAIAVFVSVVGVLLCLAVVMMREPHVQRAPAAQNSPDDASAGGGQRVASNQTTERAPNVNAALATRVEALEWAVKRLDRTRELDELHSRVAELERSMRSSQQTMSNPASRSQTSDISRLQQEIASLKRAQTQLASKVSGAQNQAYPARNDLRVLQQKVFSLENTVQRLESRR